MPADEPCYLSALMVALAMLPVRLLDSLLLG
jgi:hypothetical protein